MAKVSDIIFCAKANNIDGVGATANNILTAFNPEYIPGLFSFSIIVTIIDIDCSKEHTCSVDFIDPSNESVFKIEDAPMPLLEDKSNLPKEYKGLNIAMDLNNVDFKRSGLYTFKVAIDGIQIGEKGIFVKGKNE